MKNNSKIENVIIIGSGPSGLAAALYTARATLAPVVIGGSPAGGQLMLTSEVENYPGFESVLGADLINKMRKHAEKFGARYIDANVQKFDLRKRPFAISIADKASDIIFARSIIVATGAKALWLGLESEQRLLGRGVSACATCDGFFFKGKTVAVVGGGDTAMEEALTLSKFAQKIYLIHRRDSFRASKIMQERVMTNPKIEILWNCQVTEVLGKDKVEGIKLKEIVPLLHGSIANKTMKQSNNETILSVNGLFVAIGHKPDTKLLEGQIELDEKGYIITSARRAQDMAELLKKHPCTPLNKRGIRQLADLLFVRGVPEGGGVSNNYDFHYQYMTSVPGVFAAGDCVDFRYRQAATAVGMGVAAALEVEEFLMK